MSHWWLFAALVLLNAGSAAVGGDPLPSWNEGRAKHAIIEFVERVTAEGGQDFVPAAARIAVFDNDGTLWCEYPYYTQFAFAIDRVRALAPQHPEWKDQEPFRSILAGDLDQALAGGESAAIGKVIAATHAGMTVAEFEAVVTEWIATARHPNTGRLYSEMVYQPMLETLSYLRANGFKTYIVSGGGVEFMRPWVERVYGVPPEQVVGSRGKLRFELKDSGPVLLKLPQIELIDDGPGKPVAIHEAIGRRPMIAFGNSDGDLEMLQWTTLASGDRLGLIVHHTDSEREFAYDRKSRVGRLDRALDEASSRGWIVVDMRMDWKTIFSVND